MPTYYIDTCFTCGKKIEKNNTFVHCKDCYDELWDKIEELKEEIEDLRYRLSKYEDYV